MFRGEEEAGEPPTVALPELNVRLSAGDGEVVLDEEPVGHFHIDAAYFAQELGVPPSQVRVVRVQGDSMEPTFRSGDPVAVWIAKDQPRVDGIWVLEWAGAVHVKRVAFRGRELQAHSDNDRYPPMHFDLSEEQPDWHLVGRAIWSPRLH